MKLTKSVVFAVAFLVTNTFAPAGHLYAAEGSYTDYKIRKADKKIVGKSLFGEDLTKDPYRLIALSRMLEAGVAVVPDVFGNVNKKLSIKNEEEFFNLVKEYIIKNNVRGFREKEIDIILFKGDELRTWVGDFDENGELINPERTIAIMRFLKKRAQEYVETDYNLVESSNARLLPNERIPELNDRYVVANENPELFSGEKFYEITIRRATYEYKLTDEDKKVLKKLEDVLSAIDYTRISIEGHADSSGNDTINDPLSLKRAEAVYAELIKNLDKTKISYIGYGSKKPIADNSTKKGRALNRRVDVKVVSTKADKANKE
jgi:outer membrane protein OmpA-like peptidoglycan-associated protein